VLDVFLAAPHDFDWLLRLLGDERSLDDEVVFEPTPKPAPQKVIVEANRLRLEPKRLCHGLLRDGAKIVEGADDILDELGIATPGVRPASDASGDAVLASLTPGEPADLDAIVERTGVSAARLLPRLFELELQGLVVRTGGGRFLRN